MGRIIVIESCKINNPLFSMSGCVLSCNVAAAGDGW